MLLSFVFLLMLISGIFLLLYAAVALIQNKKFFSSAPKDVRAVIQEKPERFRGAHLLGWVLAITAICLILSSFLFAIVQGTRAHLSFGMLFVRFLIILDGYKMWDMLFIDRYLLIKSGFFERYYPEVAGTKGMSRSGFNTKSQLLKLLVIFPLIAFALTGICSLFIR